MIRLRISCRRHEQGVTLIELLAVVVILTVILSAIVVMLTSLYRSYSRVTDNSDHQRTALLIENQVVSDLRQATTAADGTVQVDLTNPEQVQVTVAEGQVMTYDASGGQIEYRKGTGDWIPLSQNGTLQVTAPPAGSKVYTVRVYVGSGDSEAVVSTTVAPYDWGK